MFNQTLSSNSKAYAWKEAYCPQILNSLLLLPARKTASVNWLVNYKENKANNMMNKKPNKCNGMNNFELHIKNICKTYVAARKCVRPIKRTISAVYFLHFCSRSCNSCLFVPSFNLFSYFMYFNDILQVHT